MKVEMRKLFLAVVLCCGLSLSARAEDDGSDNIKTGNEVTAKSGSVRQDGHVSEGGADHFVADSVENSGTAPWAIIRLR